MERIDEEVLALYEKWIGYFEEIGSLIPRLGDPSPLEVAQTYEIKALVTTT